MRSFRLKPEATLPPEGGSYQPEAMGTDAGSHGPRVVTILTGVECAERRPSHAYPEIRTPSQPRARPGAGIRRGADADARAILWLQARDRRRTGEVSQGR